MQLAGFWEAPTKSTKPRKLGSPSANALLNWAFQEAEQRQHPRDPEPKRNEHKIIHDVVHTIHGNNHRNAFTGWQTAGPHGISNWQATLPICSLCHQRDLDWHP